MGTEHIVYVFSSIFSYSLGSCFMKLLFNGSIGKWQILTMHCILQLIFVSICSILFNIEIPPKSKNEFFKHLLLAIINSICFVLYSMGSRF